MIIMQSCINFTGFDKSLFKENEMFQKMHLPFPNEW